MQTKIIQSPPEHIERIAFILKTVAHPLRLSIVEVLGEDGEMCVNQICEQLGSEQSLTSHHLHIMKLNGILASKRAGKQVFYRLKEKDVTNIISCLENCSCNFQ